MDDLSAYYKIGFILRPHGLKGEVTVSLEREQAEDLSETQSVFIEKNRRLVPYFIESFSLKGDKAFIKFEDVNTPEEAGNIARHALYRPKSSRPDAGKNQFYSDEVIGFEVQDARTGPLGNVMEVLQGPNRLLSLRFNDKEVLIPVNGPFIKRVDKEKRIITVDLPEGFLDI